MIKKLKSILKLGIVQQIIYGLGFLLWTIIMWDDLFNNPFIDSSIGIPYITLYLIPAVILGLQVVRNNLILWWTTFGLFSMYLLISFYMVISDAIVRSGNHVKAIEWTFKDIVILLIFFGTLGVIDWVIYQMKPTRFI